PARARQTVRSRTFTRWRRTVWRRLAVAFVDARDSDERDLTGGNCMGDRGRIVRISQAEDDDFRLAVTQRPAGGVARYDSGTPDHGDGKRVRAGAERRQYVDDLAGRQPVAQ